MIPKSHSPASSRFGGLAKLLILTYLSCLGNLAETTVSKGEILKSLAAEPKNSNDTSMDAKFSGNRVSDKPVVSLDRRSRALPLFGNAEAVVAAEEDNILESVQKLPSEKNSVYVIPHLRPGRSSKKSQYIETTAMIPLPRYGRSGSLIPAPRFGKSIESSGESIFPSDYMMIEPDKRENNVMIPILRYGRSDTLIPIPRFGRSFDSINEPGNLILDSSSSEENSSGEYNQVSTVEEDAKDLIEGDNNNDPFTYIDIIDEEGDGTEILDSVTRRHLDDDGTVVPHPRLGRETETDSENTTELQTNEVMIPQIRYGRSSTKTKPSENEKPHFFILPNIRPGRSSKDVAQSKVEKEESILYGLLPYPRPGRSSSGEQYYKRLDEVLDSMFDVFRRTDDKVNDQNALSTEKVKSSVGAVISEKLSYPKQFQVIKEQEKPDHEGSLFVIPYPRPGKRNLSKKQSTKLSMFERNSINYPYLFKIAESVKKNSDFILPYPRLGKKDDERASNQDVEIIKLNGNENGDPNAGLDDSLRNLQYNVQKRSDKPQKASFVLPYPRLGRSNSILPYPRPGRSNSILPYPRLGRSNIIPYPRPGRSETILPYPRLGRSDIVPYPRPERSDTILPYPRLGRSNIVPYPRPGRSDTILPHPRLGRSIVPYPRPGRSDMILPYPRPGRSTTIVPYPRLGRSSSIIPFPRPGRSDVILPYPRPGRSSTILPYPRLGRSNTVLPYPRLGRSNTIVPLPRPGRSATSEDYILPYPRMGRSFESITERLKRVVEGHLLPYTKRDGTVNQNGFEELFGTYPRDDRSGSEYSKSRDDANLSKKLNKHTENELVYLLPYPRPGRFIKENTA